MTTKGMDFENGYRKTTPITYTGSAYYLTRPFGPGVDNWYRPWYRENSDGDILPVGETDWTREGQK